jgi:hypothetical protein
MFIRRSRHFVGNVFQTFFRILLEAKGLLKTRMGDPAPLRRPMVRVLPRVSKRRRFYNAVMDEPRSLVGGAAPTGMCSRVADVMCNLLEPDESAAIRGDLAEAGATGAKALRNSLGLVARSEAERWRDWRRWFALVALLPSAYFLVSLPGAWPTYTAFTCEGMSITRLSE